MIRDLEATLGEERGCVEFDGVSAAAPSLRITVAVESLLRGACRLVARAPQSAFASKRLPRQEELLAYDVQTTLRRRTSEIEVASRTHSRF
jgi:hypothetical protein